MGKKILHTDKSYSIINQGIGSARLFSEPKDFLYFLECLETFNTREGRETRTHRSRAKKGVLMRPAEDRLVDILGYCLMPDHFHLLLRQRMEKGIALFMQKLGTAYTMYSHHRHGARGHVFRGKYQILPAESPAIMEDLLRYLHLRPLKRQNAQVFTLSVQELDKKRAAHYPWSSCHDYVNHFLPDLAPDPFPLELSKVRPKIALPVGIFNAPPDLEPDLFTLQGSEVRALAKKLA